MVADEELVFPLQFALPAFSVTTLVRPADHSPAAGCHRDDSPRR